MKFCIPYLEGELPLEVPDENLLALAEPNDYAASGGPREILAEALGSPSGESLPAFLRGSRRLLIIINDATRPTPSAAMLTALEPFLEGAGLTLERRTLLVATGAHRGPTEAEYRQVLGEHFGRLRSRCVHHDARREDELVDLGSTRGGTPLLLNRRLFEADRIIVTGSVEPHYFAGFTGGRKAFLPGVAGRRSIEANHRRALSPGARALALEGNPVHEDMMDALPLIKAPVFSLMAVLDRDQRVAAAASGDIRASFEEAVGVARRIFCVPVPAKADVVVSVAKFPMDIDLYQSQKAIDNGALALKDGGTLILVSSCRDGIGDEGYARLLGEAGSPGEALERIRGGYKLGYHKAAKMAGVSERAAVVAVTELTRERLGSMFMGKGSSLQGALEGALGAARERGVMVPQVLVMPDGCVTVPEVG